MSWIGVDFDRTLHHYTAWNNGALGPPVLDMLVRVRDWISQGRTVKIVTARVASCHDDREVQRRMIQLWCAEYIGAELEVTAEKDKGMIELWDDSVVRVERNTGRRLSPSFLESDE